MKSMDINTGNMIAAAMGTGTTSDIRGTAINARPEPNPPLEMPAIRAAGTATR